MLVASDEVELRTALTELIRIRLLSSKSAVW